MNTQYSIWSCGAVKLGALIFVLLSGILLSSPVSAQQPPVGIPGNVELDGYVWSSNIGWISLNCKTGGATGGDVCGSSNYSVSLSSATGLLTGYAWSSNIGWLKFNGLSSFPTGSGTISQSARVTGTYPNLNFEGWARACAGTLLGDCSTMVSRSDGWDGWISLRGTGPDYGISSNGTAFNTTATSFAWGSDVVGWITFGPALLVLPPVTLAGATCTIPNGASACNGQISWNIPSASSPNIFNVTSNTTYSSSLVGTNVPASLQYGLNTIVARDATAVMSSISLTTSCLAGSDFSNGTSCQTIIVPAPVISVNASAKIIRSNGTSPITWTISRPLVAGETCTMYGPGMPGSVTIGGTKTSNALKSKTKFVMSCSGPFGTVEATDLIDVIPVAQEI